MSGWLRAFDAVSNLVQLTGRLRKGGQGADQGGTPAAAGGPLAQLETRLAGVVVAALKEAFDRDRARMDLEREHLEAERRRAEEALRAELRRHAADRALGQVRLVAMMAMAVWMLSAALGVWLPGMRAGAARALLGSGWACAIAALGCAFAGWQRVSSWGATDTLSGESTPGPGLAERLSPWLLLAAVALSGLSLLIAL
jgi:hypothetical protein